MHRARHSAPASRAFAIRPRVVAAAVVASAGLVTAVWVPSRFDDAAATERRPDRSRSQERFTFTDDFRGPRGESVDPDKWTLTEGGSDDGRQVFTDHAENARLDGDGNLVITARRDGDEFTSARLLTRTTFADDRGRVEARIKVADDQGIRSVFQLLGADDLTVLDNLGSRSRVIRGAIGDRGSATEARRSFAEDFHTFAVTWAPGRIVWTVDGEVFLRSERSFDAPFTPALSLTVGSARAGAPDDSTRFPQRMLVDFVRVYADEAQEEEPPTTPPPAAEKWKPFRLYQAGDRVTFDGITYEVRETHTSLPGWEPPALTILFKPLV
ncbi:MAG TPA: family 16 glycosylhydrolase [Actinoplanes sp.]|nr:family 16 glycosylhydrolase [Actinoplanes sp.]